MGQSSLRTFNKKIMAVSAILVSLYLALVISVAYIGQEKLKDSHYKTLDLKVKSYASTLENLFTIASEDVSNLTEDKSVQTFFANLASGMSMEYGLGASLINVKRKLNEKISHKTVNHRPIYNKLTLLGYDGSSLISTAVDSLNPIDLTLLLAEDTPLADLKASRDANGNMLIQVIRKVQFSGRVVAYLVADINPDVVINQLTYQEHEDSHSRMELAIDGSKMMVWDSIEQVHGKVLLSDNSEDLSGKIYFEVPGEHYHFTLLSWFEPLNQQDIFTSKIFIYGLVILGVMIIFGLCYAFILNNAQVELSIKLQQETKTKSILSQQNHKLTKEIAKRKASESALAYQAKHDVLTSLPNRSYALERLNLELARAERTGQEVLVMFIDLDHFKQINDSMGHFFGDEILKLCVERLQQAVRKTDLLARIGGDEFLLILPELTDHDAAQRLSLSLLKAFETPFVWKNQEFFLSASIGMSIYPRDGSTSEQLVASADMAMYRVKQDGRNGFCFYDHNMNDDLQRFLELENRLRNAISHQMLELYYQPIVHLASGRVVGAEALMRWQDEKYGFVNPEEFISIAERNGLIHQLGEFAIRQATQQAAQWQQIVPLFISVNFSSVQFRYCDQLLVQIENSLQASGLPGEKFDVEVTESLFFNHSNELMSMLDKLRERRVKLTIDDFGTGYSALSYIQRFPFDRLKIDRSFIKDMLDNDSDKELVNVIIAMAKALGLQIVAEGIEEQRHVDYLNQMQCEYGQGFFFSRPLPAKEFEAYLRKAGQ